jgi:hypothetical protein
VTASLATVYFGRPDTYDVAIRFQTLTLDNWPRIYPGWSNERLRWYRRVEYLTLELMEKRKRDRQKGRAGPDGFGGFGRADEKLDDLFPGVRYIGPGGKYRAGEMDSRMRDKLSPDALAVVEQILFSMPNDLHLQWQLAELFNAEGEVWRAHHLLNKLFQVPFNGEGLRQHMLVLEGPAKFEMDFKPEMRHRLLFDLAMPGSRFAQEVARGAWEANAAPDLRLDAQPVPKETGPDSSWLPEWKTLAIVGFPCGVVLGMLLLSQFRQIFGRVRRAASSQRLTPSPPVPQLTDQELPAATGIKRM